MRKEFCRWRPRKSFQNELNQYAESMDPADIFCQSDNQWMRDAFAAARFAEFANARKVRLIEDVWPDFEIELKNEHRLKFEFTEADMSNRCRGREYADWKSGDYLVRPDPYKQWRKRRAAIPSSIDSVVQKKLSKKYHGAADIGLFIYLNLGTYGEWQDEIERDLIEYTKPAAGAFNSVWVWWSGKIYRCWPNPFLGSKNSFRPNPILLGRFKDHKKLSNIFSDEFSSF